MDTHESLGTLINVGVAVGTSQFNRTLVTRTRHQTTDVATLAEKLGIHPAIVSGRVRHETKKRF